MNTRIVFMGSPEFAIPVLKSLNDHFHVVGVVTQPDRPAGRGKVLTPPPVKKLALELNIPFIQPQRLKDAEAMQQLHEWRPEVIVVAAFGQILRQAVLSLPPYGCVNVHASLLPRWRGAAPVQSAILHGDKETGVTIMLMDVGVDTGPILSQRSIPILPEDTGGSLSHRLSLLGADLLLETLPKYLEGSIQPQPQDESGATYAPMLSKADGLIDCSQSAEILARKVRAYNPSPGTYILWDNLVLKIHKAHRAGGFASPPGKRLIHQGLPAIACAEDLLVLDEIQPAGKRAMSGDAFLRGVRTWEN